jgi:hypothetical protein
MLLRLVSQMAQQRFDAASSTISPADAALQLLCRFCGPSMVLADIRQAQLHVLVRLPLLSPSGEPSRKALLVHCSVMAMMAAKVAIWVQEGSLPGGPGGPGGQLLEMFEAPLAAQMQVGGRPAAALPGLTAHTARVARVALQHQWHSTLLARRCSSSARPCCCCCCCCSLCRPLPC